MSRNKKNSEPPARPSINPDTAMNDLDFDSLEEKIRGEDILAESEMRSHRESREVKKKLDESEVDRRLAELKKKLKK